jgi:hypothetical protein
VEFLFVEIMLLNRVILVGSLYRPPNSSIVYRALESGVYGLDAFGGVCSDLLSLYGKVFILGDFNIDFLYPGPVLFEPFSDLLKTFMLHNSAILLTRRVSGKFLDLFLVSVSADVNDFYQMTVPGVTAICCFCNAALSDLGRLLNFTVLEDLKMLITVSWYFVTGINVKVDLF